MVQSWIALYFTNIRSLDPSSMQYLYIYVSIYFILVTNTYIDVYI